MGERTPEQVNTELRARGIEPYRAGDKPDVGMTQASAWARRGGARTGDRVTAQVVNLGRLLEILEHEHG